MRFEVTHEVFQPVDQALPFGFDRAFQCVGVGGQEIGRTHHVDDLRAEILQTFAFKVRNPLDLFDTLRQSISVDQVLLLDHIEIGVRLPHRVAEPPIIGRVILWRF